MMTIAFWVLPLLVVAAFLSLFGIDKQTITAAVAVLILAYGAFGAGAWLAHRK